MSTLGGLLAGSTLVGIFVIVLLKEIGVPVPVPSDLLMISVGVQAASGQYSLGALVGTLALAVFAGCSVQFLLARGSGRGLVYRCCRYVGLSAGRLDALAGRLRERGALAVFAGLNVPGVRAGIILAAGLADLRFAAFAPAMLGGNGVYYGWHIALGYLLGPTATALLASASLPLAAAVVGLAGLGLVGWLALRRRRRAATAEGEGVAARLHAWTEAACPACLAVSVVTSGRMLPDGGGR